MREAAGFAYLFMCVVNILIAIAVVPMSRRLSPSPVTVAAACAISAILVGNAVEHAMVGLHFIDDVGIPVDGRVASQAMQLAGSAMFAFLAWRADNGLRLFRGAERAQNARDLQAHRLRGIGTVTSGAAHDFGNILGVVNCFATFAERDLARGDTAAAAEDIRQIKDAAASGIDLTEALIAFNRPLRLEPEPIAVDAVVAGLGRMLEAVGEGLAVDVDLHAGAARILADGSLIERSVLNLVKNSAEAGATRVRIATAAEPGGVRVAVSDNGAGMTEEVRANALDPFFTTKPRGEGTGLGLASVYGLVRHADGIMDIASAPGRGTTVTLLFPVVTASEEAASNRAELRPAAPTVDAAA